MKIEIDEAKLAAKLNSEIDMPYVPESVEGQLFSAGVSAAAEALVRVAAGAESLAEYGVTVTA